MTIKLNCLACGHVMDLSDAYEDYQGGVRCWGCRAVLEVTIQEGKLKAMRQSHDGGLERASTGQAEAPTPRSPVTAAEAIPGNGAR